MQRVDERVAYSACSKVAMLDFLEADEMADLKEARTVD